jgi:hypothetical protein
MIVDSIVSAHFESIDPGLLATTTRTIAFGSHIMALSSPLGAVVPALRNSRCKTAAKSRRPNLLMSCTSCLTRRPRRATSHPPQRSACTIFVVSANTSARKLCSNRPYCTDGENYGHILPGLELSTGGGRRKVTVHGNRFSPLSPLD